MKPFEEQYTAWIDGRLTDRERTAFEARLKEGGLTQTQAEADRIAARQLGDLLRQPHAAALRNPEFFNQQILGKIETAPTQPAPRPWPFWRMIWGGLGSLGIAALLFAMLVLPALHRVGPPPEYYAQILNAEAGDDALSAVAFHSKKEKVTVLWIEGLDYLPAKTKN